MTFTPADLSHVIRAIAAIAWARNFNEKTAAFGKPLPPEPRVPDWEGEGTLWTQRRK